MQRLFSLCLGRLRRPPPSGGGAGPCAAEPSEVREEPRGGLHGAAAAGDLARLRRHWWRKRFRINGRDAEKQTPLHLACAKGQSDVVRFLARKKCQLNPRDGFQKSPLMKAVEHQHKDCVAILLEHGADPNLRDVSGNTALHLAAITTSKPLVELLLEHNADIEAQNELGYTPLAVAIAKRSEELVEFLLQKGADVHAQDKNKRTTLMVAALAGDMNIIQILLQYGADLSQEDQSGCTVLHYARVSQHAVIEKQLEQYMGCEKRGERSAGDTEGPAVLDSSCSGKTADPPLATRTLTGAGAILHRTGCDEDKSLACVLPTEEAQEEKDDDSSFDSKSDCEAPREASNGKWLRPVYKPGARVQPIAEGSGNGVFPAAGAQEQDDDSTFDSESDCEAPTKASADELPPAADGKGACAQPVAEESGNGVFPAAGAQEQDDDSTFDSESDCEASMKVSAGVWMPPAYKLGAWAKAFAEKSGNGVFPAAGEQEQDDDSTFDSESDCEAPTKASADELPPAADGKGACAQPVAEEGGNGVFPAAGAQEQDDDSTFDSESDCEAPTKASAGVWMPPAYKLGAWAKAFAEKSGNGVFPAAGAQEQDDDSTFDSESDCEAPTKASADVLLPLVYKREAWVQPVAEESGNGVFPAAGAQVSAPESEELPLKKDASCQTDSQGDKQTRVKQPWQELANPLQRSSLTEAQPEAVKLYSMYLQAQKLQLQKKLYRSKAELQELKERHILTECYAEYLKNAIKRNERELKTSRNLQDLLTTSSATAASPELEDPIQRLQGEKARLEATVRQQAKTIEALRKNMQARASSHNGLEDSVTGFQTARTAKEHQRWQRGSESKEVKMLGKTKCRSEALPDEVSKRSAALEEEQTRLKMLLQMSPTTLTASAARRRMSQLSFRGEMKTVVPN
ncbi:ankyrin repeat domain-containing protein 30A-like isoform X24 [Accipiter gentilis]|uniref:ankyrin repeat domain-containing protein 30A-like isoform X17 n=1 Tax=Astur gentilis TaxID=8957 RepID=UPI002110E3D5|nr:ankyrin repeat domain-containing protein 30A-like isoform X17 [Accipiter gentilis]XP_049648424.1 ankyrin repeat domain-containing protein 30A-like isoform X18 [Accipiter gentilis]XP_049648425.1 ankyrin repeat domain-containing protein 30A-like isoform X19 [Accipiter gentilis]XP_049648426.1 ankyrin repeat domain-containing protein 30A-like isoform X20 [Accipiter gentilis]XP_049648427.1 ankyrin repeat domain-containing protein 30A-like isoform X21 [Accipiter gentilis]XP_049648428.1 ankyrin re